MIQNPDLEDIVKHLEQYFVPGHVLKYLCKQARYTQKQLLTQRSSSLSYWPCKDLVLGEVLLPASIDKQASLYLIHWLIWTIIICGRMHKSGTYGSQNWNGYDTFVPACCQCLHIILCLVILFLFFRGGGESLLPRQTFQALFSRVSFRMTKSSKATSEEPHFLSDWSVIMQGAKCYILTKMGEVRVDVCQRVTDLLLSKNIQLFISVFFFKEHRLLVCSFCFKMQANPLGSS